MPAATAVSAREVVREYGPVRALDGLTLDVPRSGVFGLAGPNGSGKSTFLALVAAAEQPDAGTLTVLGVRPDRALRGRLGVVFQENTADPGMTPVETLTLCGRLYGMPRGMARERARALLLSLGLGDRLAEPVLRLSGGMRRRVELARALMARPALLLLDEPTSGVDPGERNAFWDIVREQAETMAVLVATNDLAEAEATTDGLAFLSAGRVVAQGTPAELKRGLRREVVRLRLVEPADRDLVAAVARLPGAGHVAVADEEVRVATEDASTLAPAVLTALPGRVRTVTIDRPTLEDAYFAIVGAGTARGPGSRP